MRETTEDTQFKNVKSPTSCMKAVLEKHLKVSSRDDIVSQPMLVINKIECDLWGRWKKIGKTQAMQHREVTHI